MVTFSVFNELSLPFTNSDKIEDCFIEFFHLLSLLKDRNLRSLRMDSDFKELEIMQGIYFPQFFGQIKHRELRQRVRSFVTNGIVIIESPLIEDEEDEEELMEGNYIYNGNNPFLGGLACCDIWNSISISFRSDDKWDNDFIIITKNIEDINIRHLSQSSHIETHHDFFEEVEEEFKLEITQNNFWERRKEFFPDKILFCKEVRKQIEGLDTTIFRQAMGILRDVESARKAITDYRYSLENQSVKNDEKLKKFRLFTIRSEKVYFDNHIKSLPHGNRIYFLEEDGKIYIGYIGKHLPL